MIKRVVLSLTLTLIISIGIGFVLQNFIGFWQGTIAALITHFIVFYIFNPEKKSQAFIDSETAALDKLFETQTVTVDCPCGKNSIAAPILLNTENMFKCDKCQSTFRVNVAYESVLITEPINNVSIFNQLKGTSV